MQRIYRNGEVVIVHYANRWSFALIDQTNRKMFVLCMNLCIVDIELIQKKRFLTVCNESDAIPKGGGSIPSIHPNTYSLFNS